MIKRFEDFKLNEMKGYPFASVLIIFDGDNMIDNAFYFENHKDAQYALSDLAEYAELIGDLSVIKSIDDNKVIGFKCQNLTKRDPHRESHIPPVYAFLKKSKNLDNLDSFSVIIYECDGEEEWNSYMRYLKAKCGKFDNHNEKI